MLDTAFLVAESAAILGGIMLAITRSDEVTRGWPYLAMWLCGRARSRSTSGTPTWSAAGTIR